MGRKKGSRESRPPPLPSSVKAPSDDEERAMQFDDLDVELDDEPEAPAASIVLKPSGDVVLKPAVGMSVVVESVRQLPSVRVVGAFRKAGPGATHGEKHAIHGDPDARHG